MKRLISIIILLNILYAAGNTNGIITIKHENDSNTIITIQNPDSFLIIPIQEKNANGKIKIMSSDNTFLNINCAIDTISQLIPIPLPTDKRSIQLHIKNVPPKAVFWEHISMSNSFQIKNSDKFRPVYHHTASFGFMNDPNGLIYFDKEYHLFFQHNPYGLIGDNVHWGHSVSKDLLHWQHLPSAIARDTMGHIASGSCIIDKNNDAGFGKNAMIAFYTAAGEKYGQIQCIAISTDKGRTFKKYKKNPILKDLHGRQDFRDPKVFWHEPSHHWVMVVAAHTEMCFFTSTNLKDWTYQSSFGGGYGFECPDLFELPVQNNPHEKKWVLITNVCQNFIFGGVGTKYYVGNFDGEKFVCTDLQEVDKWLDYGKDHYATVSFSNVKDRTIVIPWLGTWQYAYTLPTEQFRGMHGLPRELSLYSHLGHYYLSASPVTEAASLRKEEVRIQNTTDIINLDKIIPKYDSAFELQMTITPHSSKIIGFDLRNSKDEKVTIYIDVANNRIVMDRSQSGLIDFAAEGKTQILEKDKNGHYKKTAINFVNDFALGTWAPLKLCKGTSYDLRIFVDKCSIELFVNDGKISMSNQVFPSEMYNQLKFIPTNDSTEIKDVRLYKLSL